MVIKEDKYYSLEDALDMNILKEEHIKSIYDVHQEKYINVYYSDKM